ncbi:transglutaminase family protein [Demequina soli]|uniref:transglutaminase family protein n=1 Tax=Demequina soli TaxID=1638987 RepID=UPI0007819545|nr:transglutaminase domain-containing protein [Demequina soli]
MSGGRWRLAATPLVAVAVGLSLAGLSGLVIYGGWLKVLAIVLGATAAVVVLARLTTGRPFLPTVAGALAGAWLIVLAYVPADDGGIRWLPTGDTLAAVRQVALDAVGYAQVSVAPAPVEPELAGAITAAVVALFLLVDAVAVGAGFAASAGFLLLAPWLPALTLERRVPTAALAGTLAAWLAVIALSRRNDRGSWRARARDGAAPASPPAVLGAAVAAVLVALLVAPLAIGGPFWGAMPRLSLPASLGGTSRLDLEIDLRDSLTTRSGTPVLSYFSTNGRVDVLRAYSMGTFDGSRWDRDPEGEMVPATGVLWPEDLASPLLHDPATISVSVGDLAESHVPVPASPRSLAAGNEWLYDPSTDEVVINREGGTRDLSYTVREEVGYTTEEALRGADPLIAAGGDRAVPARYLDLNPRIDIENVRAIAQAVTASATDRYEQGLALQEYLRGPSFTYDTEAPTTSDDMVSTFLEQQHGYCIHFATAMVVMARTLDIPARMAVGFLGGVESGDGFQVRGRDAHAWPELYFPGHGWVRFEPTPSVQTGSRPAYAVPVVQGTTPDDTRNPVNPTTAPRTSRPSAAPTTTAPATVEDARGFPWIPALAGALVLAMLAIGVARRRGSAVAVDSPEAAWASMRRRLGDRAGDDALTPAETERAILEQGPELSDAACEALARLRTAVEDQRYAPGGSGVPASQLAAWADAVAEAAREADKAAAQGHRR